MLLVFRSDVLESLFELTNACLFCFVRVFGLVDEVSRMLSLVVCLMKMGNKLGTQSSKDQRHRGTFKQSTLGVIRNFAT